MGAGFGLALSLGAFFVALIVSRTSKGKEMVAEREARLAAKREEIALNGIIPEVECPACHTHRCRRIDTKSKVAQAAMVGVLAAGKIAKTFSCDFCGFRF